jgi:hypothetical protein
MKQMLAIGLVWAAGATAVRGAEDAFSKSVRAEEFSAAGLAKLSSVELAKLDALVGAFKSGALASARNEIAVAAEARAAAEAKVARVEAESRAVKAEAARADAAKEKTSEVGLLAKAKVLLTPGTEVEYATVESRIAGDFKGWEGRAVLTLENGQRWQIANGGLYSTPPVPSPKVKIVPASLGGFWMTIEGVSTRVRVVPFGAK